MNKTRLLLFLIFIFMFASCDILRDSPYMVEAWSPGEGSHIQPEKITVSLLLSGKSDRARTEQAFSLTEDRKTMKGDFSWEGNRLIFTPASPLEKDRNYAISLGTGAQDVKGVSLEIKFEASFTTYAPGGKPFVAGTVPGREENILESRGEFRLFFQAPVTLNSCIDHISFNPSTPGSWRLEDEGRTAYFIPREPWQAGTMHRINVDGEFSSASGAKLGSPYSSVFYSGDDREKPVLLNVFACSPKEQEEGFYKEELPIENNGSAPKTAYTDWESFTSLELVFSEPVNLNSLKNLLSAEPHQGLVMESPPGLSDRAVFRFAEYPAWGSSFILRLGPGVKDGAGNESKDEYLFRINCSGRMSKPPSLAGMRLPMAPGKTADHEPLSFSITDVFEDLPIKNGEGRYSYTQKIPSWIELYFETAHETEIDLFSVMDLFRVESTNQALTFSPRTVVTEGFTWAAPKEGWENFRRIEIRGILTNTVHSGVVTFRIPSGLMDKRGNRSAEDFRISLLK